MGIFTAQLINGLLGDGGPSDPQAIAVDVYGNEIALPLADQEGSFEDRQSYRNFYAQNVNLTNNPDPEFAERVAETRALLESTPAFQNAGNQNLRVFATQAQLMPEVVDTRIVQTLAPFVAPAPAPAPVYAPPPVWAVGPQHPSNVDQAAAYQAWTPAPAAAPDRGVSVTLPPSIVDAPAPAPVTNTLPNSGSGAGVANLAPPSFPYLPRPREGEVTAITYTFDSEGNPVPVEPAAQQSSGKGWLALAALAALAFMS